MWIKLFLVNLHANFRSLVLDSLRREKSDALCANVKAIFFVLYLVSNKLSITWSDRSHILHEEADVRRCRSIYCLQWFSLQMCHNLCMQTDWWSRRSIARLTFWGYLDGLQADVACVLPSSLWLANMVEHCLPIIFVIWPYRSISETGARAALTYKISVSHWGALSSHVWIREQRLCNALPAPSSVLSQYRTEQRW